MPRCGEPPLCSLWAASFGCGRKIGTCSWWWNSEGWALLSATVDGVVMPQACVVFVLLYACFLDLATKEMEKPCPVLKSGRLALSNALFKLRPGCGGWCQLLALAWNEMGAVEKGRVQVSLFLPSGVCVYCPFLHFFFFLSVGKMHLFWNWFRARVRYFQSKYSPFFGLQVPCL